MERSTNMRAAIYCRKSQDSLTDGVQDNLDDQLEDCREIADERGYKVAVEWQENGKSDDRDRPMYRELCRMIAEGEIDVVLATEEERLYRGFGCLPLYEAYQENHDFDVVLRDGQWSAEDMVMMAGIMERELRRTRARTMRGRRRELERGKPPGGRLPYGYKRDEDGWPEINDVEAQGVRRILELYADGVTHKDIAEAMNEFAASPRKADSWPLATLRNIIYDSQFYATGERPVELEGSTFMTEYPPIIDKDLAARCQRRRSKNKVKKGTHTTTGRHLLRGLIKCPCGWTMTIRHDKRWPNSSAYHCSRLDHNKPRDEACPKTVNMHVIDSLVWGKVEELVLNPERLLDLIADRLEEDSGKVEKLESELATIEQFFERQQKEREWLLSTAQADLLSTDELRKKLDAHDAKIAGMEQEASSLRGRLAEARGELSAVEIASQTIGEEAEHLAPLAIEITDEPLLEVPEHIAGIAALPLRTKHGEGLWVKREAIEEALGHPEDLRQEQTNRRREMIERYVGAVYVKADDSEQSWSAQVELLFSSPARDRYSHDWSQEHHLRVLLTLPQAA